MGSEIVYCCQCQEQIRTVDFAKGVALKLGDRACCVKCGPSVLAKLTPQEQQRFFKEAAKFKASSATPATPRRETPTRPALPSPTSRSDRKKSPGPSRAVWGMGAALLLIAALGTAIVFRGSSPGTATNATSEVRQTPPGPKPSSPRTPGSSNIPSPARANQPGAEIPGHLSLDLGEGRGVELVYIKPGSFTMGGGEAPHLAWQGDERPEHAVTITEGFYLGKYEVTVGQFTAFVKATGYKTEAERAPKAWGRPPGGGWAPVEGVHWRNPNFSQTDDHPVVCVTWNDAKEFCTWASGKTNRIVRLPTEAEWEYACRAGTKTRWNFGEQEWKADDGAWTAQNSAWQTHPVGRKKPNDWGLYDMHGNAWEWCQDWIGAYGGEAKDPEGPPSGDRRCLRGGSWSDDLANSRASFRHQSPPTSQALHNGFRICTR